MTREQIIAEKYTSACAAAGVALLDAIELKPAIPDQVILALTITDLTALVSAVAVAKIRWIWD